MTSPPLPIAGGCQCGAVRYALDAEPGNPHICHCRMCQRAFGSYFAPLASVPRAALRWTAGAPSIYRSSRAAERGFCAACGTPLTFAYVDKDRIAVSLGSLDDPSRVKPARAYGAESRVPFFDELRRLPATRMEDDAPPAELETFRPLKPQP
ncbi:MAG: GFA family protein [Rhizobiales bacterium]|nr:GFA family protein [Hyphomicrobiales bacterium]